MKKNESPRGSNDAEQKILLKKDVMDNYIDGIGQIKYIINEKLKENSGIVGNDEKVVNINENSKDKNQPFYFHNNNLGKESNKYKQIYNKI